MGSGDSRDSSSSKASQAATAAVSEPGSEGVPNPDGETHIVSMPPVLLVAAYRCMKVPSSKLVWVPLLHRLSDERRQRELTDVRILVAKLLLWHDVLRQPVVSLKELLGGVDVGDHDMSFCVPHKTFAYVMSTNSSRIQLSSSPRSRACMNVGLSEDQAIMVLIAGCFYGALMPQHLDHIQSLLSGSSQKNAMHSQACSLQSRRLGGG